MKSILLPKAGILPSMVFVPPHWSLSPVHPVTAYRAGQPFEKVEGRDGGFREGTGNCVCGNKYYRGDCEDTVKA